MTQPTATRPDPTRNGRAPVPGDRAGDDPADRAPPPWARLLAIPGTLLFVLGGLWLVAVQLKPSSQILGQDPAVVFGVAWFLVAAVVLGKLRKALPGLGLVVRATFLVCAIAAAVYWVAGSRDRVVEEDVVTAAAPAPAAASDPAAGGAAVPDTAGDPDPAPTGNVLEREGEFVAGVHPGEGTARIIERAEGGRVLTLSDFETDAGPDLRVYLAAGDPEPGAAVTDFVDLGRLRGNRGDQQYDVPADTDVARYDTVVVWCAPFEVSFTQARLEAP